MDEKDTSKGAATINRKYQYTDLYTCKFEFVNWALGKEHSECTMFVFYVRKTYNANAFPDKLDTVFAYQKNEIGHFCVNPCLSWGYLLNT